MSLKSKKLSGKFFKDFNKEDFKIIKDMGFDTIWPMGIFPVGKLNRSGNAGGSVFSIRNHETINPELGSEEDFKNFVSLAHSMGIKIIIDFVGNHTSQDSFLLKENPEYFMHEKAPTNFKKVPDNHFLHTAKNGDKYFIRFGSYDCGQVELCTWNDVAQVDYSNIKLQDKFISIINGWVENYDVDGFRIDMAYQNLNSAFARNFNVKMPKEEFFTRLISSAENIKPETAFIAEAYDNQAELSVVGFDLFYNKSEWTRLEGQSGWYDAFMHASLKEIVPAINRAAFLSWQKGGSGGLSFFINHDEPSAQKVFGKRLPAVAMMTMLLPSAVLFYNGAEIGFDGAVPHENKTLPLLRPDNGSFCGRSFNFEYCFN
jgi:glycosidase